MDKKTEPTVKKSVSMFKRLNDVVESFRIIPGSKSKIPYSAVIQEAVEALQEKKRGVQERFKKPGKRDLERAADVEQESHKRPA